MDELKVTIGSWRPPTYSEEAGELRFGPRLDVDCGRSRVTVTWGLFNGLLTPWRIERAKRRVVRMERRRLETNARMQALLEN